MDSLLSDSPRADLKPWRHTLVELSRPRRSGPISLVTLALLSTEWSATHSPDAVFALGLFLAAFVLVVPALYGQTQRGGVWVMVYALVCAGLVGALCFAAPLAAQYESYVAHPPAALAISVLVAMGGWVLGRDIDLSDGLAAEKSRSKTLQLQAEDARLVALRQQLDPHFLFNTLGAIAEWCREDPLVAERALIELSTMLRTLFDGVREAWWPLERELKLLRALQHLYAVRDEERYAVRFEVEEGVDRDGEGPVSVPPLILLSIFENALTHGSGEAATTFEISRTNDVIDLRLWNTGEYAGPRDGGTGIDTTQRRLQLAYRGGASLDLVTEERDGIAGTHARIRIPARAGLDVL